MNKKALALFAAVLTAGSSVCVSAAEIFSDINDVPWGGAQAYINSVYENGLMVGDVDENGMSLCSLFITCRKILPIMIQ